LLLKQFFDNYYQPLRLQNVRSKETIRLYGLLIQRFSEFLERPATTKDLTNLTVARFVASRLQVRSPHTAERERNQLIAMWRLANTHRIVDELPDIKPLSLPRRTPKAWTVEQLHQLVAVASHQSGMVGEVRAGYFWRGLILCLFETAERIGAIMECESEDLQRLGKTLTVKAEYRKGGKVSRTYHLSKETTDLISAISGKEHIFVWPKYRTYLWDRFRKISEEAGLYEPRLGFHTLRRSAASHYAACGMNPSMLLGHSDPRVTERYLDPRITEKDQPKPHEVLPKIG
jgi:integrase